MGRSLNGGRSARRAYVNTYMRTRSPVPFNCTFRTLSQILASSLSSRDFDSIINFLSLFRLDASERARSAAKKGEKKNRTVLHTVEQRIIAPLSRGSTACCGNCVGDSNETNPVAPVQSSFNCEYRAIRHHLRARISRLCTCRRESRREC